MSSADTPKYDGCSGGMSKLWRFFGSKPPWEYCCDAHDIAYAKGGTWRERRISDLRLQACIELNGYPRIAVLMYHAVRVGGAPWTRLPWRWGFETKKYKYTKTIG